MTLVRGQKVCTRVCKLSGFEEASYIESNSDNKKEKESGIMRKNLRRLAVFGLTAAMGAAMLTGCGGKSGWGGIGDGGTQSGK